MKVFIGKVVGTKTAKTATVEVERIVVHPIYLKRFKRSRKYQVHDEIGVVVGQRVKFVASKPYSKTKKWKIMEVVVRKGDKTKTKDKEELVDIKLKVAEVKKTVKKISKVLKKK